MSTIRPETLEEFADRMVGPRSKRRYTIEEIAWFDLWFACKCYREGHMLHAGFALGQCIAAALSPTGMSRRNSKAYPMAQIASWLVWGLLHEENPRSLAGDPNAVYRGNLTAEAGVVE